MYSICIHSHFSNFLFTWSFFHEKIKVFSCIYCININEPTKQEQTLRGHKLVVVVVVVIVVAEVVEVMCMSVWQHQHL